MELAVYEMRSAGAATDAEAPAGGRWLCLQRSRSCSWVAWSPLQKCVRLLAGAQRAPGLAGDQQADHASSRTKEWQNAERENGGPVGPVP